MTFAYELYRCNKQNVLSLDAIFFSENALHLPKRSVRLVNDQHSRRDIFNRISIDLFTLFTQKESFSENRSIVRVTVYRFKVT